MTTTPTPEDLVLAIARALADNATPEHRRAGRQACLLLAPILGEPGEPIAAADVPQPPPPPRPDVGQVMDVVIHKLQAFLTSHEAAQTAAATAKTATTTPGPSPSADPAVPRAARPAPPPARPSTAAGFRNPLVRVPRVPGR